MNRDLVKGMAIGVGLGILAPMMFPAVRRMAKPTVNAAIRAGAMAWERGRAQVAEWAEYAEDVTAEARLQRLVQEGGTAPAPTPAPGDGEARHG